MSVDVTIDVSGIEELQAKLNRLQNVGAALRQPFIQTASDIQTYMKEYPPLSAANVPRPGHTHYERGYGSKYTRVNGSWTGRKTSQMLNRSWSRRSTFTEHSAKIIIGTRVTYARFVHDKLKQARFHKARKWRTVQDAVEKYRTVLIQRVSAAIDRALR